MFALHLPAPCAAVDREAELATVTGWLRYQLSAAATAVSGALQHLQRGGRVAPLEADSSSKQQPAESADVPAAKAAHGRAHSSTGVLAAAHREVQHQ